MPRADAFLYQQVLETVRGRIESGALRVGDKLPSLRRLSSEMDVSVPTVRQAYVELEREGRVEARPKSGYFVTPTEARGLLRKHGRQPAPTTVRCCSLIDEVYAGAARPGVVNLATANPSMACPATKTLHRAMKRVMSRAEERSLAYAPTVGDPALRRQIAFRYLTQGGSIDPEQVIITNGAQEALSLALRAVAGPGDVIAVESPSYHGQLEMIEAFDMLALEIETCPEEGIELDALERAFKSHSVKACMFSSAINNPLGSRMSDAKRKALVELCERYGVPLIEDDVYGDLTFDGCRPHPAQLFAKKGLVVTCSSFSKTVAPGYRIGWLVADRYLAQLAAAKRAYSCSSGLLQQMTLTDFIGSGDYERYRLRLVAALKQNSMCGSAVVARSFPKNTRMSRPQGGSVLWIEVPGVDSVELFRAALGEGVAIMPGTIFAAKNRYKNFIRVSFGYPWPELDRGLETLGAIATRLS
ncbi:MAG: PLP-dependent aminotransferase family protein [Deltaproteobacteria bacterium]